MKLEPKVPMGTELAVRDSRIEPWHDPEWQRLWLAMQVRPWQSLAVIPASSGAPVDFTLRIAMTLARTGMMHLGRAIQVADGTKVPLAYLTTFMDEVKRCTKDGDLILVALVAPSENPISVSVAQNADCALLCVLLGRMASSQSKRTVAQVGPNRFVGSAIFRTADLEMATSARPA